MIKNIDTAAVEHAARQLVDIRAQHLEEMNDLLAEIDDLKRDLQYHKSEAERLAHNERRTQDAIYMLDEFRDELYAILQGSFWKRHTRLWQLWRRLENNRYSYG